MPKTFIVTRTALRLRLAAGEYDHDMSASLVIAYSETEARDELLPEWLHSHPRAAGWRDQAIRLQEIPLGAVLPYTFADGWPREYYRLRLERVPDGE